MRQRYYNSTIKRFINQDVLIGDIANSQSLNRYAYVQGNPVNYTDPFGLNPIHILKPYASYVHDILNVAGIFPGPVGAISDLLNAGLYALEGEYEKTAKYIIQAGLTFVGGKIIGNISKLGTKARVITAISLMGAGMYTAATSGYDFYDNFTSLVDEFSKGDKASVLNEIHYMSGIFTSVAGMVFGFGSIVGGISLFDGTINTGAKESWYNSDGSINYPTNNGAVPGTEKIIELNPGDTFGRYGVITAKSNFVTEIGANPSELALPPTTDPSIYQEFIVVKKIPNTIQSIIRDWAGSKGGGIQYELPLPIRELLENGSIEPR